jgi:ribosomal protein L7/L12
MNKHETFAVVVAAGCALGVAVIFISAFGAKRRLGDLRARGIYPGEGMASDSDVLRLLQAGEKIMAIRCYREIHKVGLKEAKDAVDLLESRNT